MIWRNLSVGLLLAACASGGNAGHTAGPPPQPPPEPAPVVAHDTVYVSRVDTLRILTTVNHFDTIYSVASRVDTVRVESVVNHYDTTLSVGVGPPGPKGDKGDAGSAGVVTNAGQSITLTDPPELYLFDNATGFKSGLFVSRNDEGTRLTYNHCYPPTNGTTYCRADLPQETLSFETDGSFSIHGGTPLTWPKTSWDLLAGKDWKVYPQGWRSLGDNDGQWVSIIAPRAGTGFEFRYGYTRDNNPSLYRANVRMNERGLQLSFDDGVSWVRVVPCTIAGTNALCYQ